jgi:glycosyltransferase involved in cell wall biosynthesis
MRLRFLTSTPLDIVMGSGTFAGIGTLARAVRKLGVEVRILTPGIRLPVYTATRLVFNEQLSLRSGGGCDATVGFDMDGYRVAGREGPPHIASIKGVIADEMRFERGLTRLTMAVQAACERKHVRRADLVMTTSRYAAGRIEELYGIPKAGSIVPELIDLAGWRKLFQDNPAAPDPAKFTVLSVCRFYPRKRLHLLLEAAERLRDRTPGLEVRLVGGGPEYPKLEALRRAKRLEDKVLFLGDVSSPDLAREYNRCDVFCLPSVQEGFGIVFLEAMAAGKPVVAARAAAVPEVVPQGLLVEPDNADALAEAIWRMHREPDERAALAAQGRRVVEQYDAPKVAELFLKQVQTLVPGGGGGSPEVN